MASEEVRGSFCRYDSCVITDQLATDAGALSGELLTVHYLSSDVLKTMPFDGNFFEKKALLLEVSRCAFLPLLLSFSNNHD